MKDSFSAYHPVVNLIFLALVLAFAMIFLHPFCLFVSLGSGLLWSVCLNGRQVLKTYAFWLLPCMVLSMLLNPAFNHRGQTILAYLPSNNPLTLESIIYGMAAAWMLGAVVVWFSCLHAVLTAEKLVYLLGRLLPSFSLVLAMAFRFIPRFKIQLQEIQIAQQNIGRGIKNGNLLRRLHRAGRILSVMLTWSLENAVDTADSMKARGYGLSGRTAYSIFTFTSRDGRALLLILLLGGVVIGLAAKGFYSFQYFPKLDGFTLTWDAFLAWTVYGVFCFLPVIFDIGLGKPWKHIG